MTALYDNRGVAGADWLLMHRYHADLQPTVGGREEEGSDVVGVSELQQPLSEPGLVPAGRRRRIWTH